MLDFLNHIPTALLVIGSIVVGFIAVYGLFDRQIRERNKERDALEDRVRLLYKEEAVAQEEKINQLSTKIDILEKDLTKISAENKLMKDLLQGRDKGTVDYQKQGLLAMKLVAQNGKKLDKVVAGMAEQNTNIERLALAIEKHLSVTEKTVITKVETQEVKTKEPKN